MSGPVQFGKYVLLGRLAQGGMAEVLLAQQRGFSGFEKLLVVKRILPQFSADDEFIRMLIDEANIAAQLNHPNIVHIYDLGTVGGDYYIAMEYIEGRDVHGILRALKRKGEKFALPHVLYIVTQVCKGLHYAHTFTDALGREQKIIHRDISPSNVLVSHAGNVKLVDFGIARADQKIAITKVGMVKGKFPYLSPEQAEGHGASPQSDVFSLGCVFYEMLAGRRVYDDEDDREKLRRIREGEIPTFKELGVDAPEEVERIIRKMMARNLKDRYQNAAEVRTDVQRFLNQCFPDYTNHSLGEFMQSFFSAEIARLKSRIASMIMEAQQLPRDDGNLSTVGHSLPAATAGNATDGVPPLPPMTQQRTALATGSMSSVSSVASVGTGSVGSGSIGSGPADVTPRSGPLPGTNAPPAQTTSGSKTGLLVGGVIALAALIGGGAFAYMQVQAANAPGAITVKSEPAGAEVVLDGQPTGLKTPTEIAGVDRKTTHKIALRLANHGDFVTDVSFREGEKLASVLGVLKATTGEVIVTSTPAGARVFVGGDEKGITPFTLTNVADGEKLAVELKLEGYQPWQGETTAAKGRTLQLTATLDPVPAKPTPPTATATATTPAPGTDAPAPASEKPRAERAEKVKGYGYLDISTRPWATIFIDGKPFERTTPVKGLKVPAGQREIRLMNPGFGIDKTVTVEVKVDETEKIILNLD